LAKRHLNDRIAKKLLVRNNFIILVLAHLDMAVKRV